MKIVIFGTGAVGGYFGGRLAQAGNDVTFIARGKHLQAIRTDGLRVKSICGDFIVQPAKATDKPETIGVADLVLCCVKSWQVKEICFQLKPMVGAETIIVPIQNGIEAHSILAEVFGDKHVLPGLCKMISLVESPGVIAHLGIHPYLSFGELDGSMSQRIQKLVQLFTGVVGITANGSSNIQKELWLKFMIIAAWSGLGAITRSPVGIFRQVKETRDMLQKCVQEVVAIAEANGVLMDANAVEATLEFLDQAPAHGTASMQRDIMAGKPSELHEQCGAVVRFGEKAGVPTPVNRFIYHSLLPQEKKARTELDF